MITIRIYKAESLGDRPEIEPVTIEIIDTLPLPMGVDEVTHCYELDAQILFLALRATLPMGTMDRLNSLFQDHTLRTGPGTTLTQNSLPMW